MVDKARALLTLDRPATYCIRVPGELAELGPGWTGEAEMRIETGAEGAPVTTLTMKTDQAGLHSLLRGLYRLGLPILSVTWLGER